MTNELLTTFDVKNLRLFVDDEPGCLMTKAKDSQEAIKILEEQHDWFYWFVRCFPSKKITFKEVE